MLVQKHFNVERLNGFFDIADNSMIQGMKYTFKNNRGVKLMCLPT